MVDAAKENKMELQELVERIQRWRLRQEGGSTAEVEQRAYQQPPLVQAPPAEEAQAANGEEQISELDVEPESEVAEEVTSEVNAEQIEDQIEEVD